MTSSTELRDRFVETVGMIAQTDGLPRIAGRALGLLIWEGEAISFGAISKRLSVSRGSVSSAMRLLEERALVRRVSRPGERQDFFEMVPDPFATMLEGYAQRTARSGAQVEGILGELPEGRHRAHVGAYADFYRTLTQSLAEAADMLRTPRKDET